METYNFWQDFFATYPSSPDAIIALTWALSKASAGRSERHSPHSFAIERRASENAIHNGGSEQVLIFAAGRLLDQFEVPTKIDGPPRS